MSRETSIKIRALIGIVIIGLVISGLTAFPLLAELNWLSSLMVNEQGSLNPSDYTGLSHWILKVREGLDVSYQHYPFLGYGTDWLAFAHIVIALFFVPVYRDPVRYSGNIKVGLWACFLVVPLALICGEIRDIPFYWRLIDCSFGVFACIPLLWTLKLLKHHGYVPRDH